MKNNKRYWLRGGIIGIIILILYILVPIVFDLITVGYIDISFGISPWQQSFLKFIQTLFGLHSLTYGSMLGTQTNDLGRTILNILNISLIILPILIGVIVGFIYGKIINRNK